MNCKGLQGGQGRTPKDILDAALAFGIIVLATLALMMLTSCNCFSRLYTG